jgi:5-methylcytosine-specific restriction endonuclease McrA
VGYTLEQARKYNIKRRDERRKLCMELLGGICVNCGTSNNLQFDHINPNDVIYRISEILTHKIEKLLAELEKCQLLCIECHRNKTNRIDRIHADQTHGTLSSYKWCKCEECRKAKNDYMREYLKTYRMLYGR